MGNFRSGFASAFELGLALLYIKLTLAFPELLGSRKNNLHTMISVSAECQGDLSEKNVGSYLTLS